MAGDCYERDGTDFSNEVPEGQGAEFGLTVRSHKANDLFSQLPFKPTLTQNLIDNFQGSLSKLRKGIKYRLTGKNLRADEAQAAGVGKGATHRGHSRNRNPMSRQAVTVNEKGTDPTWKTPRAPDKVLSWTRTSRAGSCDMRVLWWRGRKEGVC